MTPTVAIIGAGPAGLTAAYLLAQRGIPVTVIERDPQHVGGLCRTVQYKGFHFDIGGHRFFSKSKRVEDFWTEILPDDMLVRPRSSRIYYNGKFYTYPLKPFEALRKLGVLESGLCVLSYLKARLASEAHPKCFEDWVTNQFGARLFRIFFKTYTEKVWGMSCKEISADWAAQRIKGLSLGSAIRNGFSPKSSSGVDRGSHQDADPLVPLSTQGPRDVVGGLRTEGAGDGRSRVDGAESSGVPSGSVRRIGGPYATARRTAGATRSRWIT